MNLQEYLEAIRVELVCACRSPDARNREPDFGAAHRAVCASLSILAKTQTAHKGDAEFWLVPKR